PTILLIIDGDTAIGTGRSINGLNIFSIIEKCSDLLLKFGGHSQAIGFTVEVDKIDELRNRLKKISEEEISPEMLEPTIEIDTELKFSEINQELLDEIEELEPFGIGNPYPVFMIDKVKVEDFSRVGSIGEHLKLRLNQNNIYLTAIGWGLGELADTTLKFAKYISVVGQLENNFWQDKNNIQLLALDIKPVL
ncbi:MAG: DHHA1 domain-containing protein, partial [Endomicrobiia bacterium]